MSETLLACPYCGQPGRTIDLDVDTPSPRREYGCPCLPVWTTRPEEWNRRQPGPTTARIAAKLREYRKAPDFVGCTSVAVWMTGEEAAAFLAERGPASKETKP